MTEPEDFYTERDRIRASVARRVAEKKGKWASLPSAHKKYIIAGVVVVLIVLIVLMGGFWDTVMMPAGEGS